MPRPPTQTADAYRKAYNGQFGPQYLVGPPLATYRLVRNDGTTTTVTVTPASTSVGYACFLSSNHSLTMPDIKSSRLGLQGDAHAHSHNDGHYDDHYDFDAPGTHNHVWLPGGHSNGHADSNGHRVCVRDKLSGAYPDLRFSQ